MSQINRSVDRQKTSSISGRLLLMDEPIFSDKLKFRLAVSIL